MLDSLTIDHGSKVAAGNCLTCLMEDSKQVQTTNKVGKAWICEDHK